jgi:hypothetical protein
LTDYLEEMSMRLQRKCVSLVVVGLAVLLSHEVMFASISSKFDAWARERPGMIPISTEAVHIPLISPNRKFPENIFAGDVRGERQILSCNNPTAHCLMLMAQVKAFAQQYPGHLYILGDEYTGHCVVPGQDPVTCQHVTPEIYADWYHQFTSEIRSVDATARFAPAGLGIDQTAVAEAFRVYYHAAYGVPPPVYEWRFHGGELGPWSAVENAAAWSVSRGATMMWSFGFFHSSHPDWSAHAYNLMAAANADWRIHHVSYWSYDGDTANPQHNLVDAAGNLTPIGNVYKSFSLGTPSSPRNSVMEIGDFNGDGYADFANHDTSTGVFSIHLNNGVGGFSATPWSAGGTTAVGADWDVLVADFTCDGLAEFADVHVPSGQVWVHRSVGGGMETWAWGFADMADGADWEIMAADIDGDNCADLVERQLSTGLLFYTRNTTSGGAPFVNHAARKLLARTKNGPDWRIMLGDFTGDGKADYADQYVPSGQFWIHRNIGAGDPARADDDFWMDNVPRGGGQTSAGGSWRTVVGDFSGDGYAEYADLWTDSGGFWLHYYNPINGTFVPSGASSGFGQADPSKQILGSR